MGILPSNPRSPWLSFFTQIALLYSQALLLVLIPAILVFHYAWHNRRMYGIFALTYFPGSSFFRQNSCARAWAVRVESKGEWYLNSNRIEPDRLPDALRAQIGPRTTCFVLFDANSDIPYAEAIHAIDLINESPGRVVLLTPKAKSVHIP